MIRILEKAKNKIKKGFTLVEMLGVIVIVGLIVLLIVPFVANVINNSRQKMYAQQLKNIELAAKTWGSENLSYLPKISDDSVTIFLFNLKFDGFIAKDIKNPVTGDQIPDDLAIQITKVGKSYKYEVLPKTGGDITFYDASRFRIILNGGINQHVELNSLFAGVSENDIIVFDSEGEMINSSNVSLFITESNLPALEVVSISPKTYFVEYKINYDDFEQSVFRIITVSDTLPPSISFAQSTYLLLAECPSFDVEEDVTVTDNSGHWILDVTGTLACELGTYTLVYTATDASGNVNTKNRIIHVVETLAGDSLPDNDDIKYIYDLPNIGENATPCEILELEFTHILDKREGKTYAVTKIGNQCWFADNLAYTTEECLNATWDDISPHNACRKNGGVGWDQNEVLYQWGAAMNASNIEGSRGLCPVGWHIPTHDEWTTLEREICTSASCETDFPYDILTWGYQGTNEGQKLKSISPSWSGTSGTNIGGFNAKPVGSRGGSFSLNYVGSFCNWWTSSSVDTGPWRRFLNYTEARIHRTYDTPTQHLGHSIRCLLSD